MQFSGISHLCGAYKDEYETRFYQRLGFCKIYWSVTLLILLDFCGVEKEMAQRLRRRAWDGEMGKMNHEIHR